MAEVSRAEMERLRSLPEVESWRAILTTFRLVYNVLESRLQKKGCTVPRLQIFFILFFEGPQVPVKLANRLLVTRGNISTLLKRMQDEGLIEPCYETGTDSRPAYKLTQHGEEQFTSSFPGHIEAITKMVAPLSPELIETLEKIQVAAQER